MIFNVEKEKKRLMIKTNNEIIEEKKNELNKIKINFYIFIRNEKKEKKRRKICTCKT